MDQIQANRFAASLLGTTVGGWTLTNACNAGKSAVVLKGERSGETAAIKIFDPELIDRFGADRQSARIERELTLRGKEHPNLVRIIDGGLCEESNYWFIVMEYIDAPNMAAVLETVPRNQIRALISQVAGAARFLEDLQLAHRDIKPDNIAVYPDFNKAVLLDLGVVRPFGLSELTDEDQITFVGTLQYSSPEFLLRDEIDTMEGWRAVTFYQLGAVLYDLIERRRIFSDFVNPYGRLVRAIAEEIPEINATDVSPELILLARNCLHKDPELRLRFVSWKDFDLLAESRESAQRAKERIRKRQGLAKEKTSSSSSGPSERLERTQRLIVGDIRTRIEEIVRKEFISSDLFLPIEIHEFADEQAHKAGFVVFLKAAERLALSYSVSLIFDVELLEPDSHALSLSFSAAVSDVKLERDAILRGPTALIFEGVFEETALAPILEKNIYSALDQAQQIDRNREGLAGRALQWLSGPQTDIL